MDMDIGTGAIITRAVGVRVGDIIGGDTEIGVTPRVCEKGKGYMCETDDIDP